MRFKPLLKPSKPTQTCLKSHYSTIPLEQPHSIPSNAPPQSSLENKYTNLIQICLQQCWIIKAHNPFDEMSNRIFMALRLAKIVHAQSLTHDFCSEGLLAKAILDLYAKCGNVDLAHKVFKGLQEVDIFAWNSILSMYSKQWLLEDVVKSFALLMNGGVLPNDHTFAVVLSACARLGYADYGRQVHCNVIKAGFDNASYCVGALINMYAKCNCIGYAQRVLDGVVDVDTVSWTSMISGYAQAGLPEEALKVFEKMQRVGRVPDQVAYGTVINLLFGLGKLDDACKLFFQIVKPDVEVWNHMISGYAKRGYEVEAIDFFREMRKSGVESSRSTLGSILSAIANLSFIDFGFLIHSEAIKQGLESNVYVGSSLVKMYSQCGKMEYAEKVFNALHKRNLVLCNAMLAGYSQNDYANEVLKLFSNIKADGFHPDDYTYTSILKACASLEFLEIGQQLHTVIVKDNLASNLFVGNALVDMYAKSGAINEARRQFELMRNRDIVSWNAIIGGYVHEENEAEAFAMFQMMKLYGVLPDETSLASILDACASVKSFKLGKQVHCLSVKYGLDTSLYSGSSLIDMYAKCGAIGSACKVLSNLTERSVASMNSLIAGYAQNNLEEAVILFQQMQCEGLSPSNITFKNLLDACDEPRKFNLGKKIHCLVLKRGLLYEDDFLSVSLMGMYMKAQKREDAALLFSEFPYPKSTFSWTAMISGYNEIDCSEEALQFYQQMRSFNVLPDQATFVSVLKACASISSLKDGQVIHSLVFHTGLNSDEKTGSALVDMYAKCGDIEDSIRVFEGLGSKSNVISWNSMITGLAINSLGEEALQFFHEMKRTNVAPDDITFLGALTACSHAGKVSEGRQIFDSMVNFYRIQPRDDHCASMVDLLGRFGFLEEAEEFINRLEYAPGVKVWSTFLSACRTHGDDVRGKLAGEKLIELEPENSSYYVLLSNIYAALGNWDEANALRKVMREKGLKKNSPGSSWIVAEQ
ncbi:hypothetical protein ACFE04_025692 [Oxalis oulophora]